MGTDTIKNDLTGWVKERYHVETFTDLIAKKTVPLHKYSVWYYFGGITLFLFIVQIITGILLLFYYKPTANTVIRPEMRHLFSNVGSGLGPSAGFSGLYGGSNVFGIDFIYKF